MEIALGLLWLLDGLLQAQPAMFGRDFFADLIGMSEMNLPGPLLTVDDWAGRVIIDQPVLWNALFAALQVALGVGLLWRRTAGIARVASVPWALAVWVIGEGFGGMFMGGTSLLTGAPGAALTYAVLALALIPPALPPPAALPSSAHSGPSAGFRSIADEGRWRGGWVRWCWALLWIGPALLELTPTNHSAGVPAAQLAAVGENEPGWLAVINQTAGGLLTGAGGAFALTVGVAAVLAGSLVLFPATRRIALVLGAVLAVAFGLFGQDLGGLLTGQATDPGSAVPLLLLAVILWPARPLMGEMASGARTVS